MQVGRLHLKSRLIAAPLAGFTDASWRLIAHECGAGLTFSEMISCEGLIRAHKKTTCYLKNFPEARPFGVQLFGANPDAFAKSFEILSKYEFDVVDINMGCPVKKVVSKGAGSALMCTPKLVEEIMATVRKVYKGPLTFKIRSGWSKAEINAVEIAKIGEFAGADAVIVHPRTREQMFRGHSDWKIIAEVKSAVKIPVIGNGDVVDRASAAQMTMETGCDGVMIGRAAISNPLIFYNPPNPPLKKGGKDEPIPPFEKGGGGGIFPIIYRHIDLLKNNEDKRYTRTMLKKFIPKYLKGMKDHKYLIKELYADVPLEQFLDSLKAFEHLVKDGD